MAETGTTATGTDGGDVFRVFPSGSHLDLADNHLVNLSIQSESLPSDTDKSLIAECSSQVNSNTDFHQREVLVKENDATRIQLATAKGPHRVVERPLRCDEFSFISSSHWAAAPLLLDVSIQTTNRLIQQIRRSTKNIPLTTSQFATEQQLHILTFGLQSNAKKKAIRASLQLKSILLMLFLTSTILRRLDRRYPTNLRGEKIRLISGSGSSQD